MSLDPKLTLGIYIGASIVFIAAVTYMFVYSFRLKAKKAAREKFGRPEVTREEGIAVATQNKRDAGKTGSL